MANTLTSLAPDLYEALDIVSRELVGFIPAVTRDSSIERAALNQTVRSFVAPASTSSNITPGLYAPDDGNQTVGNKTISISKSKYVPIRWNGEEQRGMNSGPGYLNIRRDQIAQAIRALCNEVEADLAALHVNASRAFGTIATTPFASTLTDPANMRKILADNGAPLNDMHLVLDTTAGAKLRTLGQLSKANEAGDTSLLRQGVMLDLMGFEIRESAAVKQLVTVGTGASYDMTGTHAVGATTITVGDGTGTILAGDIILLGSDTNKYVVTTGFAGDGVGTIVIGAPGLLVAHSDEDTITIQAATNRNMAFSRNAIVLVTRAPIAPIEGDMAEDAMFIQDPRSGLGFEVRMYKQYRQVKYEIALAWGMSVIKPEHLGILVG